MKIIILVLSLIVLISLHVFADTYAVTLDVEQEAALAQRAEEMQILPDDLIQELVTGYFDSIVDEDIRAGFEQLGKHERREIARRYLKRGKGPKERGNKK